jgi:hypothetical protein
MSTRFTPGPWNLIDEEVFGENGTCVIASVMQPEDFPWLDGDFNSEEEASASESRLEDECDANAALIADAPEMYDLLRLIVDNIKGGPSALLLEKAANLLARHEHKDEAK